MPKPRNKTLRLHAHPVRRVRGIWHLNGTPLLPGDLVELRRVRVAGEDVGDHWVPGVVGREGDLIELDEPGDFVPGSRASTIRAAGLKTLVLAGAEIRRA